MKGTPFQKLILMMTLVALAAALVLQFINSRLKPQSQPEPPTTKSTKPEAGYTYNPSRTRVPIAAAATSEDESGEAAQPKIPRDKAEAWLAKRNRNAASLLAVFRALGDTNYLNEAATSFPNDPQVQLAVLSRDVYPEDRRKWLEAFKTSSPDNSLANYLSAADYFRGGKSDEAVQELLAASGKKEFQNYAVENLLNVEELSSDSGLPPTLASSHAMACISSESLPLLADFKLVSQFIGEAMKNDPSSAAELAQVGLEFTGKINSGDSGKLLINQLVGTSSERIILAQLDQNTAYDFLDGQTPAQVSEAYKQQKAELYRLAKDFGPAQLQMIQSESETASYMQRMKIYGELAAMKWLIQQHPPAAPQQ
jgi:hypothetical protein